MQGTEVHLFPVVCRTYIQPDKTLNQRVIESMDGYPSQQSNLPEGVITSRPDLHKIEKGPITELRQFFWDCLAEYRYAYKLYCDALEISSMWFNHAPAGSGFGHPLHRHPMSYLSAVYYLTPGAPTGRLCRGSPRQAARTVAWLGAVLPWIGGIGGRRACAIPLAASLFGFPASTEIYNH